MTKFKESDWPVDPRYIITEETNFQQMFFHHTKTLFGILIQQNWSALYMLEKILTEQKFDIIIELGTGHGALATFFSYHAPTVSIDINYKLSLPPIRFEWWNRDVFHQKTIDLVKQRIENKKALIFCDNGDKARELKLYAPLIDHDDMIMAHDYHPKLSGSEFWRVGDKDIPLYLEKYRQPEFNKMGTLILCLKRRPS